MSIGSEGQVNNPVSTNIPDGTQALPSLGRQGDTLKSDLHGKYYTAAYRGDLYWANVTAKTVPVIASGLVSVFTLWNPPGSGVVAEIVDTEIATVLATTVVDAIGWYYSPAPATAAGTFTTPGVFGTNYGSARLNDTPANKVLFFSAFTHSGTPIRADIIGSFGAVTDAVSQFPVKIYDGRLILPPGIAMSVAMSTAAGTASGLDISARWTEWAI